MLRKVMGTFVALMLVATLLLPLASVGAQDDEIDPGAAPAATEETLPESEPLPAVDEPPIAEPQPEAPPVDVPVVDEPVVEQPAPEAPPVEEPVAEQPAAEEPAVEETTTTQETAMDGEAAPEPAASATETTVEDASTEDVEAADEAPQGSPVISGFTADCSGNVSFNIDVAGGLELRLLAYAAGLPGHLDGTLDSRFYDSSTSGPVFTTLDLSNLGWFAVPWVQFTLTTPDSNAEWGDYIYGLINLECGSSLPEDPDPDPPADRTIISGATLACDGTVTFTITEAAPDSIDILVTDRWQEGAASWIGFKTFEVTETGTFSVSVDDFDQRDNMLVSISGSTSGELASAAASNCQTEEEETSGLVSGLTVGCDGSVSFTVDQALVGDGFVVIYDPTHDPSVIDRLWLGEGVEAGSYAYTLDVPAGQYDQLVARVEETNIGQPHAVASVSDCLDDETPEEPAAHTVISSSSLACDGTLTFTIDEAVQETLGITLMDPDAPVAHRELAEGSFEVTSNGEFELAFDIPQRDTMVASITSGADEIGSAVANCGDGASGAVQNMSVTCEGAVSFAISSNWEGDTQVVLYGENANTYEPIASESLGHWVDAGDYAFAFDVPTGIYDRLVAQVETLQVWDPRGSAEISGCSDEEPELPQIQNLLVTCNGLVTFDLETNEPVVLDVSIFIPAAAPGYRDETQITAESGPQRVQFDLPVHPFEWAASVSLGAELLADAGVQGCPTQPLNTLPGSDVTVPVAGGTVTFENVLEPGETQVMQLDPEFAPPLPAQYDGRLVIMVDLSTTAVFDGVATVCLPITPEVAADAENVRLLHFENGAWVDITISVSGGQVCGVTSHFSPFAIVKLSGQEPEGPGGPGEPSGPHEPGHHGPKPGAQHARPQHGAGDVTGGVSLTSLPNTGGGAQSGGDGIQTIHLLLCALALVAAAALRLTPRRGRARSR